MIIYVIDNDFDDDKIYKAANSVTKEQRQEIIKLISAPKKALKAIKEVYDNV